MANRVCFLKALPECHGGRGPEGGAEARRRFLPRLRPRRYCVSVVPPLSSFSKTMCLSLRSFSGGHCLSVVPPLPSISKLVCLSLRSFSGEASYYPDASLFEAGITSRRRDCHFAGTFSSSLLKRLLKVEGGCSRMTASPTARHHDRRGHIRRARHRTVESGLPAGRPR